jgi:hypothetical protein
VAEGLEVLLVLTITVQVVEVLVELLADGLKQLQTTL